jgi:hypothetical protein
MQWTTQDDNEYLVEVCNRHFGPLDCHKEKVKEKVKCKSRPRPRQVTGPFLLGGHAVGAKQMAKNKKPPASSLRIAGV